MMEPEAKTYILNKAETSASTLNTKTIAYAPKPETEAHLTSAG